MTTWTFPERLGWEQQQAAFLAALWSRWWPGSSRAPVADLGMQRAGVDAIVSRGRVPIQVEEKVRDRDYGDVLVELVSNDATNAPGWAVKGAASNLLLYAIRSTGRGWVFPMQAVQRATRMHADDWRRRFGVKVAQNPGYRSINVPVPLAEFTRAVDHAHGIVFCPSCRMVCDWSDLRGPWWCSLCKAAPFEIKL